MYTSAGERAGRERILHFEQIRAFFVGALDFQASAVPVRIVAFRSDREYRRFQPNEVARAFYLPVGDKDYIIIGQLGQADFPLAIHEYVHLVLRRSGLNPPLWLNEGMADLYSTLRPRGGGLAVGALIPGRYQVLRTATWLDLATLTAIDHDSSHYNEKDRAGIFYAQSWALTHMLRLSEDYRPKSSDFLKVVLAGAPATEAFASVYGKSLEEVGQDLAAYMRGDRFYEGLFDARLEKQAEKPEVREATPLEYGLVLADLLAATRREDEARQAYLELAAANPDRPEIPEALAYLALQRSRESEAREHMARATELGSASARLYSDYGELLRRSGAGNGEVIAALEKAVSLNPDLLEARYNLGVLLLSEGRFNESLAHLRTIRRITPDRAVAFFQTLAHANKGAGNLEEARIAAGLARKHAKTAREISSSEQLLEWIDRPGRPETAPPRADSRPRMLRPRADPKAVEPPPAPIEPSAQTMEGTLTRFECLGKTARLHLDSGGRSVAFAILNPTAVLIRGAVSGSFDFTCGPQKPTPVRIEYSQDPAAGPGAAGVVVSIEFR
jgi:tetratricopeptide (TPR) repeat protein